MTEEIEWSLDMSPAEFVEASLKYFKKDQWDLHTLCCVAARIDPESISSIVGTGHEGWDEDDEKDELYNTRRIFKSAIASIEGEDQKCFLNARKRPAYVENGKQVVLETKHFFEWVLESWEGDFKHIAAALDERSKRRRRIGLNRYGNIKLGSDEEEKRKRAFFEMVESLQHPVSGYKINFLAKSLHTKLKGNTINLSVRAYWGRISESWYAEALAKNSQKKL